MADDQIFAAKRRYPRKSAAFAIKVFTSMSRCALTLQATELGRKGAFVESKNLPDVNEPITYLLVDEDGMKFQQGEARVAYVSRRQGEGRVGFGIEFDEPLSEEQEKKLGSMSFDLKQGSHNNFGTIKHLF